MSLHHLVEVFNDAFEHEQNFRYQPFIIKDGKVSGLFGPILINSVFSPIRKTLKPTQVIGYSASIETGINNYHYLQEHEIAELLANRETYRSNLDSIITFDRLSRTVHVLNYLTLLSVDNFLFLEVDPRHILGIKKDHGVYFMDFIAKCGLETMNVVIVLTVYNQYAPYYQELLSGLENYRCQGYKIALKFDTLPRNNALNSLTSRLSPHFFYISARLLEQHSNEVMEDTLTVLKGIADQADSKTILQQIDDKKTDLLAKHAEFSYVEGSYYRAIPFDYARQPNKFFDNRQ